MEEGRRLKVVYAVKDTTGPPYGQPPFEWAKWYAQVMGWPVVPVHNIADGRCSCRGRSAGCKPGKHPRTQHGIKQGTCNLRTIWDWWCDWPEANVGVVVGGESGILVIDVDPRNGGNLKRAQELIGTLPPAPTVRTGGGGLQKYFAWPPGKLRKPKRFPRGIDILLGDRNLAIAPPSMHLSGNTYGWIEPPKPGKPLPQLPDSWLTPLAWAKKTTEQQREGVTPERPWCEELPTEKAVGLAIIKSAPSGPGTRHRENLHFVRHLKAIPELADLAADALKPYHDQWFNIHKRKFRASYHESWYAFRNSWENAKYPIGRGPMMEIVEQALAAEPPAFAASDDERFRLVVNVCQELQRRVGKEPFVLDERALVPYGVPRSAVHVLLAGLRSDGKLRQVRKADYRAGRAAEYRWLGE